jgi:uncharacterized protein
MAVAVVTGASSGIGKAVALKLLELGYEVIGVSRSQAEIKDPNFSHLPCDFSSENALDDLIQTLKQNHAISILCNIAGFGLFEPHEEINAKSISAMVAVNLTAPMILCNALLRTLKQNNGIIFNITSIEAIRHSKFSALYSATKAGLRAFSLSLFEEVRKHGVNVVSINPDMTDTAFFDQLRFNPAADPDTRLEADDIAQTIQNILQMREGVAITDITVRAQRFSLVKKF